MLTQLLGWGIGIGILGGFYLVLASPLIVGLLIARDRIRYREWLAGLALILSLVFLSTLGDYLYNFYHWTQSRASLGVTVFTVGLLCSSLLVLVFGILKNSQWKKVWIPAVVILLAVVVSDITQVYRARETRDRKSYTRALEPVKIIGATFVRVTRKYEQTTPMLYLEGHIPRGTAVTLLSDPFAAVFQPSLGTATAEDYKPAVSDPAVLGNVTKLGSLKNYSDAIVYSTAIVGEPITTYEPIVAESVSRLTREEIHQSTSDKIIRLNVFKLNNDIYAAAMTEGPSQDAEGMNPTWINWLYKADGAALTRVWPNSN